VGKRKRLLESFSKRGETKREIFEKRDFLFFVWAAMIKTKGELFFSSSFDVLNQPRERYLERKREGSGWFLQETETEEKEEERELCCSVFLHKKKRKAAGFSFLFLFLNYSKPRERER
jgi:hypothetical protein